MKNDNVITLDQFKDNHYGKPGTEKRDKLEAGYENFKIRVLIHETRIQKNRISAISLTSEIF